MEHWASIDAGGDMVDAHVDSSPTALRLRADGCRALAEMTDTEERKAVWLSRAKYWEALSFKAAKHLLASVASTDKP
jgi:hypothetical protein